MTSQSTPAVEDSVRIQVDRILQSQCFHGAESMRHLLGFLTAKLLAGEADHLKEYSIGIDAFGKPPSYDPRSDSTVRVQIGRLRQKLADYYRTEGALDALVVEIPKGQLSITYRPSTSGAETAISAKQTLLARSETAGTANWRRRATILAGIALGAVTLAAILGVALWREVQHQARSETAWTPELEQLWAPFLVPGHPVHISFEAPMFIRLRDNQLFRDTDVNRLAAATLSPAVTAITEALHVSQIEPRYHYAPFQEVNSAFLLGKLLAARRPQTVLVRSNKLSWEQMANNNWVFIGSPNFFSEFLNASPFERQFVVEQNAVRNVHPRSGEPGVFGDQHSLGTSSPLGFSEDGEVYAVITQGPGPLANSNMLSFESNVTPARLGAVQWFTDPELASKLVAKLRGSTGKLPRYYQVVIKVKYKDAIPVESAYVAHRELQLTRPPSPQ